MDNAGATQAAEPPPCMWIDADRVFYSGLLGQPAPRTLGAHLIYLGLAAPLELCGDDGRWKSCAVALVPAYKPHQVRCRAPRVGMVLVEPETVPDGWPGEAESVATDALLERCRALSDPRALTFSDFDTAVFGQRLPVRDMDPRVQRIVQWIKQHPDGVETGEDFARDVHLSRSRFIHLFGEQVGVPLRRFRAWRRARLMLEYATTRASLLNVAMRTGYPDATHFSHSIRQAFGLSPSAIVAGSRRLALRSGGG